ncbi:hypothetical protein L228DRAFT_250409 [Xylona heveae TC161]|uniref:Uncharacterized protein n=1 Tax=Xylona heveae (strain CBS 132557 / TC161) TaxID=1328760 RepID=A0A165A5P6_XYLHT|nr:hypothetical protein L228DRAFT_250409 [Xylona heveae TC161]KZF19988.1 hypothetical protein L228DRAFT_250409 [Xylona heveae TC161]
MTVATLQAQSSSTSAFPHRSHTHPLHNTGPGRRVKKGEPFDPAELCRRLEQHRKQDEEARRRRSERAEKYAAKQQPQQPSQPFRYTPQYAAADFAATSMPDPVTHESVHILARPVIDRFRSRPTVKEPQHGFSPSQLSARLEAVQADMDSNAERNQFQRTRILQDAANREEKQGNSPRHSRQIDERPLSMGDLDLAQLMPKQHRSHYVPPANDRPNWAETDECEEHHKLHHLFERIQSFGGNLSDSTSKRSSKAIGKDRLGKLVSPPVQQREPARRRSSIMGLFKKA